MYQKSISVFFPSYNEEENVRETVLSAHEYLKPRFADYEILVISCASTDRTGEIVKELMKTIPHLRLITGPVNPGYAFSVRTGFLTALESKKDLIFYTDGDRQFDIKELDNLLPLIDRYDIVTGFKIERNDPVMRSWMSWVYNLTMRLLFHVRVRDVNCAFKLYKREVIESVHFIPSLTQGVINTEVYASAMKHGYTIAEVPVHHYARMKGNGGDARIGPRNSSFFAFVRPVIIWRFLKDTVHLWRKVHGRV